MNISTLQYFKEIVESKSISKVAQNSHISQSALSQIIQKLEGELGYQLLNRSNKGVYPTEMGKIVYKYCGTMIRIHKKMEDELKSKRQMLENVRINGYASFINYSLPCILYKIKKLFPKYKFELHSKTSDESFNDILNEVTDMAFVNDKLFDDRITHKFIGKEKFVLVASANSRIPDQVKIEELNKYEMVLLDGTYPVNTFLDKKLKQKESGIEDLNVIFEVDTIGAAKSSISNDLGMSFLPYMSVKKELYEKSFKVVQVADLELDFNIYLACKCDSTTSEDLKEIIDYFVKSGSSEFC